MRRRRHREERTDPMGLFMDPIMDFIGLMFFMVIFLLIAIKPATSLRILDVTPPNCARGLPYLFTVPVQGGQGDRTFSDPTRALTELGLQLDSASGTIHGVVAALPKDSVRAVPIQVVDQTLRPVTRDFVLRVTEDAYPITAQDTQVKIMPQSVQLPRGRVGRSYEAVVATRGGLGKVVWTQPDLPDGLMWDSGRITGTPARPGRTKLHLSAEFDGGSRRIGDRVVHWGDGHDSHEFELEILPLLSLRAELPRARAAERWSASLLTGPLLPDEAVEVVGLPEGLHVSSSGELAGTPTHAGTHDLRVRVIAGSQAADFEARSVTVLPALPQPEAASLHVSTAIGSSVDASVAYRGLVEPVSLHAAGPPPDGLAWHGLRLHGKPQKPGTSTTAVTLTDAVGLKLTTQVTVQVRAERQPFEIAVPSKLTIRVGERFHWAIKTSGGEGNAMVISTVLLPPGLSLQRGVLDGVFDKPGAFELELAARDSVTGQVARAKLEIEAAWTVSEPLAVLTASLPNALVGDEYALSLAASGVVGAAQWELEGTPPAWLKLQRGVLRGTPSSEGRAPLRVVVRDATGRRSEPAALVLVSERPERSLPVIATEALPPAFVGRPFRFQAAAQGGLGSYVWHWAGALPAAFRFSGASLEGTPDATSVGSHSVEVTARDERGVASEPRRLTLDVADLSPAVDMEFGLDDVAPPPLTREPLGASERPVVSAGVSPVATAYSSNAQRAWFERVSCGLGGAFIVWVLRRLRPWLAVARRRRGGTQGQPI